MTELVTRAQLNAIMPIGNASGCLDKHWPYINPALESVGITTPKNVSMFMGQCAHESGEYLYTKEIADGSAYEGRLDLGNIQPDDGRRYPGRGAIQNTGRAVAKAASLYFGQPFEDHPEMMETPEWATHVSVFYWSVYKTIGGIKCLPLFSEMDWFKTVTHTVNGGYNGLESRLMYWKRAREVFGLPEVNTLPEEGAAIRAFQASCGLVVDGDPGMKTLTAIQKELKIASDICKAQPGWDPSR